MTAKESKAVAHRWLRDGLPVGQWASGTPSAGQFASTLFFEPYAKWTVELAVPESLLHAAEAEIKRTKVDAQLGREVEGWVCMNTAFSGEQPYVGNAGIMLSLRELKSAKDTAENDLGELRRMFDSAKFRGDYWCAQFNADTTIFAKLRNVADSWESNPRDNPDAGQLHADQIRQLLATDGGADADNKGETK